MFNTIRTALREARQIRAYIEMAESQDFWQPIDGKAFVAFMMTSTGKKLRARLNNMVFKGATRACQVESNGDYARGIARGVLLTVQALDQHMDAARQPEPEDFAAASGANDAISELEQLALR